MAETTPTAASAHLVTHNHGRTVDTHLHEPAPAHLQRRDPLSDDVNALVLTINQLERPI